jgi:hypothetical protein
VPNLPRTRSSSAPTAEDGQLVEEAVEHAKDGSRRLAAEPDSNFIRGNSSSTEVPNGYCPNHSTGVTLPDDFVVTPLQYVD